jgi:two-component system LytT family response regulator
MTAAAITALIADDESFARERLHALLAREPDIDLVAQCKTGVEVLVAIGRSHPELVFLDVQMPDLDGLGVIAALSDEELPEIVFVTAHNAYMERAFEVHAVDYLRKPYTDARFESALAHARRRVQARRAEGASIGRGTMEGELSRFTPMLAELRDDHPDQRLALRDERSGAWQIIDKEQIDYIAANGSAGVDVHAGTESYHWRRTLTDLERTLDPDSFLRIHRSYIVNGARIRRVKPLQKGEYAVFLQGNAVLDSGRTYRHVIERFLEQRG